MFILLISLSFALQDFLTFFPAGSHSGLDLYGKECAIHILDMNSEDPLAPHFNIIVTTDTFPDFEFGYHYDANYKYQKTTKINDTTYLLEQTDSNNVLANIYFSYTKEYVEIERKGYATRGPAIRCIKK